MAERRLAETGDDLQERAFSAARRPQNRGEMLLRKARGNFGKQELIVGLIATGLVFLGKFVWSAEDAVTTYVLVLTSLATPWAVITMIGFWQTRGRFDTDSLQVFNRRERGGAYWFTHGWNLDAVAAWAIGSLVGVLSNSTTSFEGPVAHWLGGLDASVVLVAVASVNVFCACNPD